MTVECVCTSLNTDKEFGLSAQLARWSIKRKLIFNMETKMIVKMYLKLKYTQFFGLVMFWSPIMQIILKSVFIMTNVAIKLQLTAFRFT